MVEAALRERGIGKIVPADDDLATAWRSAMAHAEIAAAVAEANAKTGRWLDQTPPDDLVDQIHEMIEDEPTLSWDEALRRICT
jgi:hypothetical protein